MTIKLYNGKKDINGLGLWRKFEDWRKEIRTKYTPKLPTDISSIPSGHQLRDVYKKFALDCYKLEHVSTVPGRRDDICIRPHECHNQLHFHECRMIYVRMLMTKMSSLKCRATTGYDEQILGASSHAWCIAPTKRLLPLARLSLVAKQGKHSVLTPRQELQRNERMPGKLGRGPWITTDRNDESVPTLVR